MNKKNDGMKISSSCFSRMFIRAQKFDSGMWKQKRTEKEHKHAQHTDKTHLYIVVSSDTQTSIEKVMSIHRRKTKCGLSLLTVLHAYFANRIKLHVPRESWEQKIHSPNESNSALPKVDTQRDNSQKKNVAKLNGKITVLMHPTSQLTVGNVKSNNAPTMRRMPCTAHTHRQKQRGTASEREREKFKCVAECSDTSNRVYHFWFFIFTRPFVSNVHLFQWHLLFFIRWLFVAAFFDTTEMEIRSHGKLLRYTQLHISTHTQCNKSLKIKANGDYGIRRHWLLVFFVG